MLSVVTPTHHEDFLLDAYNSLLEQTHQDWEWVLVPNGKLKATEEFRRKFPDPRVKIYPYHIDIGRVGALKYIACEHAKGDIIVELDHDDMLTPDCLQEVYDCFEAHPDICFAYSNMAQVDSDLVPFGNWNPHYGIGRIPFQYKGHDLIEAVFCDEDSQPHDLLRTWFAPNHVRAWRAKDYWAVGGHDQSMKFSDDHDLMFRFYLHGKLKHINKCLYIYRVHGKRASSDFKEEIAATRWEVYDKYAYDAMERWADVSGLRKVNLAPDNWDYWPWPGYEQVGVYSERRWPIEDNSVGVIRAQDVVHRLKNPIHVMNEAYRVLAHGGFLMILVPSTDGRGAFCDPNTKSYWNENSFWYYTKKSHNKYIAHLSKCRFQKLLIRTLDLPHRNNLPYVQANLICIKKDYPIFAGGLEI